MTGACFQRVKIHVGRNLRHAGAEEQGGDGKQNADPSPDFQPTAGRNVI